MHATKNKEQRTNIFGHGFFTIRIAIKDKIDR
jgi:hypothetical protein